MRVDSGGASADPPKKKTGSRHRGGGGRKISPSRPAKQLKLLFGGSRLGDRRDRDCVGFVDRTGCTASRQRFSALLRRRAGRRRPGAAVVLVRAAPAPRMQWSEPRKVDPGWWCPSDRTAGVRWRRTTTAEYFTDDGRRGARVRYVDTPWRKLPAKGRAVWKAPTSRYTCAPAPYGRTRCVLTEGHAGSSATPRCPKPADEGALRVSCGNALPGVPAGSSPGLAVTLASPRRHGAKSIFPRCVFVDHCADFLNALTLGPREAAIAGQVLKKGDRLRLGFLLSTSRLEYLSCSGRRPHW